MTEEVMRAQGLVLHYSTERGAVRAVDDVTFSLGRGEALGIVGESGSGKTSLSLILMRLLPGNAVVAKGRVILLGKDVMAMGEEEFRRSIRWKVMSMVFQGSMHALNPVVRVGHQIAEPLTVSRMAKKGSYERALKALLLTGLPKEAFHRYPHELSGGMKQRVSIAMALVLDPKVVILDEPTSALDVSVQAQVTNLLKRLKRDLGLSMIFITHDIALASDICDRIAVMYAGQIVEIGSAEDVLSAPKHPYTRKLLACTPRLRLDHIPEFIPGAPPDLTDPPSGCRFHPRCPYALQTCVRDIPRDFDMGNGNSVKCWLYGEG